MKNRVKEIVKKYKIYIILLLLFLVIGVEVFKNTFSEETISSVWDGSVATSFATGSGTYSDPYDISNGSELAYYMSIAGSSNNFSSYFQLTNNIDLNGYEFSNADLINYFSGTLDGKGYTISNFKISEQKNNSTNSYSLFYHLNNATIKNINFKDITYEISENNSNISLIDKIESSSLQNISVSNISIVLEEDIAYNSFSGLINQDLGNNYIGNINLNIQLPEGYEGYNLISDYNNSNITNIIYYNNELPIINTENELQDIVSYNIENDNIVFENIQISDVLNTFNSNSEFEWTIDSQNFRITPTQNIHTPTTSEENENPVSDIEGFTEVDIPEHESGISGTTVYVNDLESSWNYYMGLNYTKVTSGSLPEYNELYTSNNLIPVAISYSGYDINQTETYGKISPTENETKIIYYKYYPVENGNVKIELIDNPFTARPTGKGFNGWSTKDPRAVLSYDKTYYTRYVTIPVNGRNKINIEMYASWYKANIQTGATNVAYLDARGMKEATGDTVCETRTYETNVRGFTRNQTYYEHKIANRGESYSGYTLNIAGTYYNNQNNASCNSILSDTCEYYGVTNDTNPVDGKSYYFFSKQGNRYYRSDATYTTIPAGTQYQYCYEQPYVVEGGNYSAFYLKKDMPSTQESYLYYNNKGESCSAVTCQANNTYKLIQPNDTIDYVNDKIYYQVTRDMNILIVNNNSTNMSNYMVAKPYTLTGSYDGSAIPTNYYPRVNSATLSEDLTIENIYISGTTSRATDTINTTNILNGNSFNLKVGRNVKHTSAATNYYEIFSTVMGTQKNGSSTAYEKYKMIVETGVYEALLTAYSSSQSARYVEAKTVYGNDYDRVKNNNNNLLVYFNALASINGNYNSTDKSLVSSAMNIKSGRYGLTYGNNRVSISNDSAHGVYLGGRTNTHYSNSLRTLTLEGGEINAINGGPCVENNLTTNSTALYMLGGSARIVFGGAATTTTYGNRIVSITGGKVIYSVFGGSNAYEGGNTDGQLGGKTLIYIGGNAIIGDTAQTGTLFNTEIGGVFGAGNGNTNSTGQEK